MDKTNKVVRVVYHGGTEKLDHTNLVKLLELLHGKFIKN